MALRYATPLVNGTVDGSAPGGFFGDLKTKLVSANWEFVEEVLESWVEGTFINVPLSNDQITVDGEAWTATFIDPPPLFQFYKGVTASEAAGNFASSYNRDSTKGHTATAVGATVRITSGSRASFAVSEGSLYFSWEEPFSHHARLVLLSVATPEGLRAKVQARMSPAVQNRIEFWADVPSAAHDEDSNHGVFLQLSTGRNFLLAGCPHQFVLWIEGQVDDAAGQSLFFSTPAVEELNAPVGIAGLAVFDDGGTDRVKVTTSAAHGFVNDQLVYHSNIAVDGVLMPALEGSFHVTVLSSTEYWLQESTWSASYSGLLYDGVAGRADIEISAGIVLFGITSDTVNNFPPGFPGATRANTSFRHAPAYFRSGQQSGYCRIKVNDNGYNSFTIGLGDSNLNLASIVIPMTIHNPGTPYAVPAKPYGYGGTLIEPRLAVRPVTPGPDQLKIIGSVWNCFATTQTAQADARKNALMGYNWINMTAPNPLGSLWFALSEEV